MGLPMIILKRDGKGGLSADDSDPPEYDEGSGTCAEVPAEWLCVCQDGQWVELNHRTGETRPPRGDYRETE